MRRSRRVPTRGFTLLEAMVSLLLLVIVLIVAMTMLFQMRAFAERQQYFMLPRQAARRATDYLSYYIAGASDLNYVIPDRQSPNALIMYYNLGPKLTQASYNNLTGTTEPGNGLRNLAATPFRPAITSTLFGDLGTDIITMVAPFSPSRYQVSAFPGLGTGKDLSLNFKVGCGATNDDAANLQEFRSATGDDGTPTGSALLMLVDKSGSWAYVRIPSGGYGPSTCANAADKNITVTVDTASGTLPAPPNGVAGLADPVSLVAGIQVISFRVLTDAVDGIPKLQQKLGLFDPATDGDPATTGFTNVLENVEDLQIAYMYPNGDIWNTASQTFGAGGVPPQAGPKGPTSNLDVSNVIGLRFSVTGRSPLLPLAARQLTNIDPKAPLATTSSQHFRPASEDHTVPPVPDYDQCDHYRATATLMIRNRMPRG